MDGLDIKKLYGSHDNEIWTIEREYRGKTKVEDFRYHTHTQLSVHTYTTKGSEKKFLWKEYGITWVVKEMKPCEYTLREWTIKLLEDCGCNLDCYKDNNCVSKNGYADALKDLEIYKADNKCDFPFPIWVIATELQAIGNEQPEPKKKPYCMICETDSDCDGVEYDDLESAKDGAIECLVNWQVDERNRHPIDYNDWTEQDIDDWNYFIDNCSARVNIYMPETDNYEWYPSAEQEKEIGWLPYEELKELESK